MECINITIRWKTFCNKMWNDSLHREKLLKDLIEDNVLNISELLLPLQELSHNSQQKETKLNDQMIPNLKMKLIRNMYIVHNNIRAIHYLEIFHILQIGIVTFLHSYHIFSPLQLLSIK